MATNKRMRGIAVHRAIVIGSTATPLSDIEKISCPPDHTHKWTIAVRSAASHPLPTISDPENVSTTATTNASVIREDTATPAPNASLPPSAPSGVSTRGREHETDYHKMVGGKDDISHFIKRVQFKLHETYPQSTRNIDRPPFQVTETGWGEFDVQIRIMFIPESGEKPITTYHRLKLHPWHPIALRAPQTGSNDSEVVAVEPAIPQPSSVEQYEADTSVEVGEEVSGREDVAMQVDVKQEAEQPSLDSAPPMDQQQQQRPVDMSNSKHPPVVHSWSYDEVVFPEPTEAFYEILLANPPTPLPTQSAHAFADVAGYNKYKSALTELDASSGPQGRDPHREAGIKPPHPLHNSSGALFDALSQEAVQAEAERFDKARFDAVSQLEETRNKLIEGERKLREGTLNQSRMMTL